MSILNFWHCAAEFLALRCGISAAGVIENFTGLSESETETDVFGNFTDRNSVCKTGARLYIIGARFHRLSLPRWRQMSGIVRVAERKRSPRRNRRRLIRLFRILHPNCFSIFRRKIYLTVSGVNVADMKYFPQVVGGADAAAPVSFPISIAAVITKAITVLSTVRKIVCQQNPIHL